MRQGPVVTPFGPGVGAGPNAASENGAELGGCLDEAIGGLFLEPLPRVDPAPADGDRERPGRLRCLDVERRVAAFEIDGHALVPFRSLVVIAHK